MSELTEARPAGNADFSMPLASHSADGNFGAVSENALSRRYGKSHKQEELVYEFTRDPALLHQYFRIYEAEFQAVFKARYQHEENDAHDRTGHFLIVRRGNLCVGGARLSVKTPRKPDLLPIEMDDFRLERHFPELAHKQMRYGQIGRLCVLPDFRGGNVTRTLLSHLYRKGVALNLDVIFGTAPLITARVYMQNFSAMGLKEPKIHFNVELPKYPMCEEIKFHLISLDVHKQASKNNVADEQSLHEENIGA